MSDGTVIAMDAMKAARIAHILDAIKKKTGIQWDAVMDGEGHINIPFLGKNLWITIDGPEEPEEQADKVLKAMHSVATRIPDKEWRFVTKLRQASARPVSQD